MLLHISRGNISWGNITIVNLSVPIVRAPNFIKIQMADVFDMKTGTDNHVLLFSLSKQPKLKINRNCKDKPYHRSNRPTR